MARIKFSKLPDYELKLSRLKSDIGDIAGKAVYDGAKIVADEVKKNLNELNVTTDELAMKAYKKNEPTYLNERAKEGLIESFGVTKMELDSDGFFNVKIGFDGYNDVVTKKYPKGQPNQLIARSVESGSSSMIKQPFMRKAVNAAKKQAEMRMAEIIDEEIKKRME
jgi:hypothetical protein